MLTVRGIAALKPGAWASNTAARGAGVLQARKLANGKIAWYFRYTRSDGKRDRLLIGTGLTLAVATKRAADLTIRYQSDARDLRDVLDAEERDAARQRAAAKRADDSAATHARATLGALLTAYVAQLRRNGKASARAIENSVRRHVEHAWPKLWSTPAAEITPDDLLNVVAKVINAGTLREAAKLRSYIRAAYAATIAARADARSLPELRALAITMNPARDLATIDAATQPRERALSVDELRAYWHRIVALPDPAGALLRFHLLTGAQRIAQLQRALLSEVDPDALTMRLRDPKGRRKVARLHDVPLIPAAVEAMSTMQGGALGPHLFSTTAGASGAGHATMRDVLARVVTAMLDADELPGGAFTPGDLRRTVETRLAAEGVPREVRGHVQSHGLGGVQSRHYDRHEYLAEKRAALEVLQRVATGAAATVTAIRGRRKKVG